ncbi:putative adrenodoxin-type ferredoxin [Cardiosporidium cionae]|uniref:2Fe-2S ferredoxin n=1 Tax=Cardiosporidium cionae TaxID=476202 RepID=A0ABQ7J6L7_9APIC|nr:putative adrenodoxin-type ferredoxin [Cardiosporidium cionae]|eukprot:KAF8819624.1 putative adrenodoxin-type ferredoxin [Cardiosporidium cionae]
MHRYCATLLPGKSTNLLKTFNALNRKSESSHYSSFFSNGHTVAVSAFHHASYTRHSILHLSKDWIAPHCCVSLKREKTNYLITDGFYRLLCGQQAASPKINVVFILRDGSEKCISAPVGISVLEVAHQNDIDLEGACEASLACSTCHVILEEETYNSLPEPSETEEDLLDLAPCLTMTSRLGCQVILTKEMDGIRIRLPSVTRNFYVDGHIPKPH